MLKLPAHVTLGVAAALAAQPLADLQWPLSARGERRQLSVLSPPHDKQDHSVNLPPYPDDNEVARALVASKLWGGSRRYSDSSSQLSDRALFHQSLDRHDLANRTGLTFFVSDAPPLSPTPREVDLGGSIVHLSSPVQSPTRLSSAALRYTPVPKPQQLTKTSEPNPTKDAFFSWKEYTSHPLPRRLPSCSTSHRDDVIKAVSSLGINKLPIKNVGKLAKPVMNKYYRTEEALASFTATAERTILLPNPSPPNPTIRFLERLESDLFNTPKYLSSHSQNLTIITYTDDSPWGTATLFEVGLPSSNSVPPPPGIGLLARRRRDTSLSLHTSTPTGAISILPIVAMELIPRDLLHQFRMNHTLRKLVLCSSQSHLDSPHFKWICTGGMRRPSYATLLDPEDNETYQPEPTINTNTNTSIFSSVDDDINFILGPRSRSKNKHKSLSPNDPRTGIETDADGIIATIPQFLCLLHSTYSIIEEIESTPILKNIETVTGDKLRGVSLRDWPKGKRYTGRGGGGVNVVVLMPDQGEESWIEEKIFWSDDVEGLRELRGGRYGGVIKRERRRRRESGLEEEEEGQGWDSPLGSARSAAW
ncbi:hypothetical protein QBC38DRAFT_516015 [Podospora fimiseda]|uniref:Uncharacterized protein n=1 Tax=Podospora fimiseda TaxID=252190 RepID=A0AAN7BIA8_9PEZI|nr:hypothetical protein QBC38DRAFT_516015 [Podospora fimiseda]